MRNIAVIFCSKYVAIKRYAIWISQELGADLFDETTVNPEWISSYDIVIFGGGLYTGNISGIKLVTKNQPKKLVVFTTGLADPAISDYSDILDKNFDPIQRKNTMVFHLRGGITNSGRSIIYKIMMAIARLFMINKLPEKRTVNAKSLIEMHGKKYIFIDQSRIKPIIDYVRSLK
jgi:hypothetical protein